MDEMDQKKQNQQTETSQESSEQQKCESQLADLTQKYLRLTADFDNFKRRQDKERLQWERIAQASVLKGLLNIIDIVDRALKQKPGESSDATHWMQGFEMLAKTFDKYLANIGVTEIKETTFDPELHEAVMHVAAGGHKSGDIVEVLQKGYMFKGQVLRPAKVSIAQ